MMFPSLSKLYLSHTNYSFADSQLLLQFLAFSLAAGIFSDGTQLHFQKASSASQGCSRFPSLVHRLAAIFFCQAFRRCFLSAFFLLEHGHLYGCSYHPHFPITMMISNLLNDFPSPSLPQVHATCSHSLSICPLPAAADIPNPICGVGAGCVQPLPHDAAQVTAGRGFEK